MSNVQKKKNERENQKEEKEQRMHNKKRITGNKEKNAGKCTLIIMTENQGWLYVCDVCNCTGPYT